MVNYEGSSDVLTVGEVARILNLHINTVRKWSDSKIIRSQRFGPRNDRIFSREDLTRFLSEGKAKEEI
jgi:excisionase family DNA binding protein